MLRALPGLFVLALALSACGGSGESAPAPGSAPGTIPVVASTDVYGALVQAVGGDRVAVTSLIDDPAADPHSYEAPRRAPSPGPGSWWSTAAATTTSRNGWCPVPTPQ